MLYRGSASIGSDGDAYDNALAESIIGLFKTEVIGSTERLLAARHGPWRLGTFDTMRGRRGPAIVTGRRTRDSRGDALTAQQLGFDPLAGPARPQIARRIDAVPPQMREPRPQRRSRSASAAAVAERATLQSRQPRQVARHVRSSAERSVVDHVVERLIREFGHGLSRNTVTEVVRRCIDDLAGTPREAIPELSERLARQRLLDS